MRDDSRFLFRDFSVEQRKGVFKVGTDGVLAGIFTQVQPRSKILEVGTGTGLISLLLANRFPEVEVTAIDLLEDAVSLAEDNFKQSPFSARLRVLKADFNHFESKHCFDWIVSNPPYFIPNAQTPDKARQTARQTLSLSANDILFRAPELLSEQGKVTLILPELPNNTNMFLWEVLEISSFENSPVVRYLTTYGLRKPPIDTIIRSLYLYNPDKSRSIAYHEASKNFYTR